MDSFEKDRIEARLSAFETRLEALSERNAELEKALADANERIEELSAGVKSAGAASSVFSEGEVGDAGEAKELGLVVSAAQRIEDPQVVVPDAHAFIGQSTRKSIEWAPEMANIPQINEFDDAPSVGNLKVVRRGRAFVLVDPDGTTGKRKWMVLLRREIQGAIEAKWAMIGEDDSASSSNSHSGSGGDQSASGPCDPDLVVESVSGTTAHPNGGYKITVTHADCTQDEYYIWNGSDGSECSGSGGSSMTCCEVRQCLAGLPAPHAISMSNNTITIQPRKYKASSGSDCIETENDGAAITFTIPTLPSHVPVTVLTDWTTSGTTIVTKKREINVVNPGNEQTTTIQGRSCEEAAEGGD